VPDTGFSCAAQQFPGYYADTDAAASCQVFHLCQADGRHDAFLCPNGTLFSQGSLVCDWWFKVRCADSDSYLHRNAQIGAASTESERAPPDFEELGSGTASTAGKLASTDSSTKPQHPLPSPTATHTRLTHHAPASPAPTHHPVPPTPSTHHRQSAHPPLASASPFHTHSNPAGQHSHTHSHSDQPSPQSTVHSHQPTHHSLPQYTVNLDSHNPTQFTASQSTSHGLPQFTGSQSASHSLLQSTGSVLNHNPTHFSVIPDSHSSPQFTVGQSASHSLPQSTVSLASHTLPHSTASQSTSQSHAHSTVSQSASHNFPQFTHSQSSGHSLPQFTVTQRSHIPTLFREDVLSLLPRKTRIPEGPLRPETGRKPTRPYGTPEDTNQHANQQANQPNLHPPKSLAYSSQESNFITGPPAPKEDERVEYDEVYSATIFPPNIPQLGDVYEAAKGRVVVKVVKESSDRPSLPDPLQRSVVFEGTPLHVPKVSSHLQSLIHKNTPPESTQGLHISSFPQSSVDESTQHAPHVTPSFPPRPFQKGTLVSKLQDNSKASLSKQSGRQHTSLQNAKEDLPSVSSFGQATILPSPKDLNPQYLSQLPHHSNDHPTQAKPRNPSKEDNEAVPHQIHVWKPSKEPFAASQPPQHTSPAPDPSLNLIIPKPQPGDTFPASSQPLQGPSNQLTHHFKIIHVTGLPSEYVSVAPSDQKDTFNSPNLHPGVRESLEASDSDFRNLHDSFRVILKRSADASDPRDVISNPTRVIVDAGDLPASAKVFSSTHVFFQGQKQSHEPVVIRKGSLPHRHLPTFSM
ncbi:mucin-12-like, partial [Scylla paramamosain]|uniref:mucin-12-like n=1 Tax=Scylla paramamosain TaxID=85552 RepID=UPI003082EF39